MPLNVQKKKRGERLNCRKLLKNSKLEAKMLSEH